MSKQLVFAEETAVGGVAGIIRIRQLARPHHLEVYPGQFCQLNCLVQLRPKQAFRVGNHRERLISKLLMRDLHHERAVNTARIADDNALHVA